MTVKSLWAGSSDEPVRMLLELSGERPGDSSLEQAIGSIPGVVNRVDDLAAVSLVGSMAGDAQTFSMALSVAQKARIEVKGYELTDLRLTLLVPESSADSLARALHAEFLE